MLPYVTFPIGQYSILRGTPAEFPSSPAVTRSFCGRCGTPLTYSHADYSDRIDVMTCILDDPEAFPPTEHVWTSEKLTWIKLADGLPMYAVAKG